MKKFDTGFDEWSDRMRRQEIVGEYFGEDKYKEVDGDDSRKE